MGTLPSSLPGWLLTVALILAIITAGVFTLISGIRAITWLFGVINGLQRHPVALIGITAALLLWLLCLILVMPRFSGIYGQFVYVFFTILVIVSCHRISMDLARKRFQRDGHHPEWDTLT
jgi:uncharacterized protein YhhL (DUF1145 family)